MKEVHPYKSKVVKVLANNRYKIMAAHYLALISRLTWLASCLIYILPVKDAYENSEIR